MIQEILRWSGMLAVGGLGWYLAHWYGAPLLELKRVRRRAIEALIKAKSVGTMNDLLRGALGNEVFNDLDKLSHTINSLYSDIPKPLIWILTKCQIDLLGAAQHLRRAATNRGRDDNFHSDLETAATALRIEQSITRATIV